MEHHDDVPDTLDPRPAVEVVTGTSILDGIRQRREERVADESVTLSLPTWDGELKAKYKVLERSEVEKIMRVRKGGKNPAAGAMMDADFMIKACVGIIAHDNETGETEIIGTGYNPDLANLLGNPQGTDTARGLVFYLVKNNGIALAAHVQKLAKWMMDTSQEPEGEPGAGA
jgi:hypothetical protein